MYGFKFLFVKVDLVNSTVVNLFLKNALIIVMDLPLQSQCFFSPTNNRLTECTTQFHFAFDPHKSSYKFPCVWKVTGSWGHHTPQQFLADLLLGGGLRLEAGSHRQDWEGSVPSLLLHPLCFLLPHVEHAFFPLPSCSCLGAS